VADDLTMGRLREGLGNLLETAAHWGRKVRGMSRNAWIAVVVVVLVVIVLFATGVLGGAGGGAY
jgi:hypothetical protein